MSFFLYWLHTLEDHYNKSLTQYIIQKVNLFLLLTVYNRLFLGSFYRMSFFFYHLLSSFFERWTYFYVLVLLSLQLLKTLIIRWTVLLSCIKNTSRRCKYAHIWLFWVLVKITSHTTSWIQTDTYSHGQTWSVPLVEWGLILITKHLDIILDNCK